eukprot:253128_1
MMFALVALFLSISSCLASNTTYFSTSYGKEPNYFSIKGYAPSGKSTYPLFIWLAGTTMNSWGNDAQIFTTYVAERGFVGASVYYSNGQYPTSCKGFQQKAELIYDTKNSLSAITKLCNLTTVDCNKGVVVAGFSQGAQLASLAANYLGSMVKAVYEMSGGNAVTGTNDQFQSCMNLNTLSFKQTQIRSISGQNDEYFGKNEDGVRAEQEAITGYKCSGQNCIQNGGSGWYIVLNAQTGKGTATHCYAYKGVCGPQFDSQYYKGCGLNCPFSLESNIGWLLSKV